MSLLLAATTLVRSAVALGGDPDYLRASYLFHHRNVNATWLDSCRGVLADMRGRAPGDDSALALWSRVLLTLGGRASSRAEKHGYYSRAAAAADTLRRRSPANPEGHMWWATAQGSVGKLSGLLRAATMVSDLRRAYERVLELDSTYALAWYALGRLCLALPPLLGGGEAQAERLLRRGVAADSHYTIIRLGLARLLAGRGNRAEARRELGRLLAETCPTEPAEFVLDDLPAAKALLDSLAFRRR
jgi:hypothetical protein